MPFIIKDQELDFEAFRQIPDLGLKKETAQEIIGFLDEWYDNKRQSVTVSTSGSTGQAKIIQLSKKTMNLSAIKTQKYFNYSNGDVAVLCMPVKYIAGKMMLVRAIISGLKLIIQDPSSDPLKEINTDVDFIAMTPHQMNVSILNSSHKFRYLKKILLGGAPVSPFLRNKINLINSECFLSYGMTETASHVAIQKFNSIDQAAYFKSLEGISFGVNENNCLLIHADHLDEEIQTNDIVELIDASTFIWKGRVDNIINSGGIKISPELVEERLSELISGNFIITSISDKLLGQKMVLLIEAETNNMQSQDISLLNRIKSSFPNEINPVSMICLPQFIYSETGKILREETCKLNASKKILGSE